MKITQLTKKFIFVLIFSIIIAAFSSSSFAAGPSYLYSHTDRGIIDVSAPHAYLTDKILDSEVLGVELKQPEDLVKDRNGNFYIIDAGMNRLYIFDNDFNPIKTIERFEKPVLTDGPDTFSSPTGIYVDENAQIYIADSGNRRVVIMNNDGSDVRIIQNPQKNTDILDENFQFVPQKLLVDPSGRLFVLCKNVFEGILQFSDSGLFIGYIGSNRVVPSAVELVWKRIMSEEQKGKLLSFVPVEYTNISIDYQGFIYAVTSVMNVNSPIRRLNPSGNDVLVRNPIDGSEKVIGDSLFVGYSSYSEVVTGPSSFVDISSDDYGNYYALDGKRGRVFGYDSDGNMLFVFGTIGTAQDGAFESPSAILFDDGLIYVLDRTLAQVIRFTPTEYVQLIQEAMQAYVNQEYENSVHLWNMILKKNSYFDLAYVKAGYGLYRLGKYKEAMGYFKTANIKAGYSKAYQEYKNKWLNENFDTIAVSVIVVLFCVLAVAIMIYKKKQHRKSSLEKRDIK